MTEKAFVVDLFKVVESTSELIEGFHLQIREEKSDSFDVVTLVGKGTRSHTLSDLRPDSDYDIFILPFNKIIKGTPSNMKRVKTKEDGE